MYYAQYKHKSEEKIIVGNFKTEFSSTGMCYLIIDFKMLLEQNKPWVKIP